MFALLTLGVAFDVCARLVLARVSTATPVSMLSRGQDHVVKIGEVVSMNCEFHMEDFNMFDNPVVWQKFQQGERTNVNIMGSVQEPFANTRRYDSSLKNDRPRFIAQLQIKDTSPEDNGNYTCELRGRKSLILGQVSYSLHVLEPIKWLNIVLERTTAIDSSSSQQNLILTDGHPIPLKCLSHGGYPPPEMTMFLGDKEITDRFRMSITTDVTGQRGLRTLHFRTSCWTPEFIVSAVDDGKVLQCIANIPGVGMNVTNSTIYVNYAPNITCDTTEAEVGNSDVQLHCLVRSRPEPTSLYWSVDGNMTIAPSGDMKNPYWTLVRDRGDGMLEAILTMRQVHRDDFRRYSLLAENRIGLTSYEVELRQKGGLDLALQDQLTIIPLPQGEAPETRFFPPALVGASATRPHSTTLVNLLTPWVIILLTSLREETRCILGDLMLSR